MERGSFGDTYGTTRDRASCEAALDWVVPRDDSSNELPDEAPTLVDAPIFPEPEPPEPPAQPARKPARRRELAELVLVHHGGVDAAAFQALARAVAAELDPSVVVHHVLSDARIEFAQPYDSVVIPIYPHASARSWRCARVAGGTTIVWFAFAHPYLEAVAASIRDVWPQGAAPPRLVFVGEDLADRDHLTSPLYPRDVRLSAAAVAKQLGCEHEVVFFGGEAHGEAPQARAWLEAHARDQRLVLVPLTHVCEGDATAMIDRELVPLALAHGAATVHRAPAIGPRIAPVLAGLARRAASDDD
jgi:hypothetical protein